MHGGRRAGAESRLPAVRKDKDPVALSDHHNARGIELADRGWLDEAAKEFLKAIELDPDSAHAHDNLATVYAEQKRFREAIRPWLPEAILSRSKSGFSPPFKRWVGETPVEYRKRKQGAE